MKIFMKSKENDLFEINVDSVKKSNFLSNMMEDCTCDDQLILPVPLVSNSIMNLIIRFMNEYNFDNAEEESKWIASFFYEMTDANLFELMTAANYLDIKVLLDLTCKKVADEVKFLTIDQIKTRFSAINTV